MSVLNANEDIGKPPHRYELIGRDGEKHGPFPTVGEARRRAHDLWPLQTQDEERTEGWDIQVCEQSAP